MRISIYERMTVGELLDRIARRYGDAADIREHLKDHPRDFAAKVALHDLKEHANENPTKVLRQTREVFIPDSAIDELTVQRLHLLLTLKGHAGEVPSVRVLARAVKRDIKNVSEDVHALEELGLVDVEAGGHGKPSRISLPGDRIDLHLVEAKA